MSSPVQQHHHDIAMLAAMAAKDRCNGYGGSMSYQAGGSVGVCMAPAAAGKAVTDAYLAALTAMNPASAKAPRKTAAKARR